MSWIIDFQYSFSLKPDTPKVIRETLEWMAKGEWDIRPTLIPQHAFFQREHFKYKGEPFWPYALRGSRGAQMGPNIVDGMFIGSVWHNFDSEGCRAFIEFVAPYLDCNNCPYVTFVIADDNEYSLREAFDCSGKVIIKHDEAEIEFQRRQGLANS